MTEPCLSWGLNILSVDGRLACTMPDSLIQILPHGLADGLILPLGRLIALMAVSLIVAQTLESLRWTEYVARLTAPLVRLARLSVISGASFSLSFASPQAANAMLAEGLNAGKLGRKELLIANAMNSAPAFLLHLPSLLAVTWAFLGSYALTYVGLVFSATVLRTMAAIVAGRSLLAAPMEERENNVHFQCAFALNDLRTRSAGFKKLAAKFRKRLSKICLFTIPVYCLIFFMQKAGAFSAMQTWLEAHMGALFFLHPGSIGIVVLFLAAENSAAFAAAAALMAGGSITPEQAVAALLVGNIISSPMRSFRHQLPSYAGFFSPPTAMLLVCVNQLLRAATLALVLAVYLIAFHT